MKVVSLSVWLLLLVAACPADALAREGSSVDEQSGGAAMSATLRMAVMRARQTTSGHDFVADAMGTLRSRAGQPGSEAEVVTTTNGVRLLRDQDAGFRLDVATVGLSRRGGSRQAGTVLDRHAEGQELVLERENDVEERLLAGPLGVEQSYVVRTRPEGEGPLVVEVAFAGLSPQADGEHEDRVVLVDDAGRVRGGYRDLVVADAEGRDVAARMQVEGGHVGLVIDDHAASYPLRIDPIVWIFQAELMASDGTAGDHFGDSVAVSGGIAVVGAPMTATGKPGAAYIFVQSGTAWAQQAVLTASDGAANDDFGSSVAVSGGIAIVGAPAHAVGANTQGAAYVFVQSGTTWTQQQELTASDGAANDAFGDSVAISGTTAIVGAPGQAAQQGAAYVFVQGGTTWTQQQELTASDGAASDFFGSSVGVSGAIAIVGAPWNVAQQGAAYVFVQNGTTWSQQQKVTASDGVAGDFFGTSVAASGASAIVGAPSQASAQGAAYVFVQAGTTWSQQAELTAGDGAPNDTFGKSVAIDGATAVVGALGKKVGSQAKQGAAYVFGQNGTTWVQQAAVKASDGAANEFFGVSVAVSGTTAMAGSEHGSFRGAVYVFASATVSSNGAACTQGSTCESGFCIDGVCCDTSCGGGVADCVSCLAARTGGADGTCGNVSDGSACNGDACTESATCHAGACTGEPVACTAKDACHVAGSCDPSAGTCSNPNAPDGTKCPGGTCTAGVCKDSSSSSGGGDGSADGGCGCEVPGDRPSNAPWLLALLPLALVARRRWKRAASAHS